MADVTSPFLFPYPEDTDLVRDGAADIEALAEAVNDAGVDGKLGGLVAVKHVIKTNTESQSTVAGGNFAVSGLSITHAMDAATNKLLISAYFGAVAVDVGNRGQVGIAIADDGVLINIGDADGVRTRVTSGGNTVGTGIANTDLTSAEPSVTFVYEPGDTASHTYTVRALLLDTSTRTVFVNRNASDTNGVQNPRATSGFVIQEVRV